MHTLLYSSHIEYYKNNDITSTKINTAAPWSHGDPLKHNLESDKDAVSQFSMLYSEHKILKKRGPTAQRQPPLNHYEDNHLTSVAFSI